MAYQIPQPAQSLSRKLSAHTIGSQAFPKSPMDFSGGTTQGDLGRDGGARPESCRERLSAFKQGSQALPRGAMDLSGGTTNGDLGQNHHEAERCTANGLANINRRGSQVFKSGAGDPTGNSTNASLGAFYTGGNSTGTAPVVAEPKAERVVADRRRVSMPGVDPSLEMDFSAGSTMQDLGKNAGEAVHTRRQDTGAPKRRGSMGLDPTLPMDFSAGTTMGDLGSTTPFPDISQTQPMGSTYVGVEKPRPKRRGSMPGVDPSLTMDCSGGTTLSDLGRH